MGVSVAFVSFHHGVPRPGPKGAEGDGAAHRILRVMSSREVRGRNGVLRSKQRAGLGQRGAGPHPVSPRGTGAGRKRGPLRERGRWGGGGAQPQVRSASGWDRSREEEDGTPRKVPKYKRGGGDSSE